MTKRICTGNASDQTMDKNGWFIGQFIDATYGLRKTSEVELKWNTFPKGMRRDSWGVNDQATSLTILIRGRFRINFAEGDIVLAKEGDYALWPPGVSHSWEAEEPSLTLTIRWPSVPEANRNVEAP
jgi:quercetin dioxygenase-like cupin family protein